MQQWLRIQFAAEFFSLGRVARGAIKPSGSRTALILTGLICSLLVGFGRPASAEDTKFRVADASAALVASADQARMSKSRPDLDDAYSALLTFAGPDAGFSVLTEFAQQVGPKLPKLRVAAGKTAAADKAEPEEATNVGSQACLKCHVVQAASFGVTLMGKIFRNPRNAKEKASCETCHGPGSLHVKGGGGRGVGGIISFRLNDPAQDVESLNAICLGCHEKGNRTLWRGSTHDTRGIACVNCHTVMSNVTPKAQLSMLTEADTCFQCHKNKRSEIWRTSHMPIREGKITCSTCHNAHGTYGESLLKTATINDTCYKCHAEKRGPFLWEHAPVRENCLNCHEAHGSINDSMLKVSRPRLCQQCHTVADHPGNPGSVLSGTSFNRGCSNCHVKIHGSNSPAGSQLVR
jgi:DmsE family decaheme c-type cytochrome